MTMPIRGLRPRTPSTPGALAVARSTGHWVERLFEAVGQ